MGTTVVKKFNGEDIDLISPTLGFNLNIWDVGGQSSLRSYWRNYFEQTDGLIWVVDSADCARLHDCKAELQLLLRQERLTADEIREELELDKVTTRHWRIAGCSAFTGAGLAAGV